MVKGCRLLLALIFSIVVGQQASAQFVMNGYMIGVAENPRYRADFPLGPDQLERLKRATDLARQQMRDASKGVGELKGAERQKALLEGYKQAGDAYERELAAVLKPGELKRLRQISLQMRGGGGLAFRDQAVRDELKLTGEQRTKVDEILKEVGAKMGRISRQLSDPKTRVEATEQANALNKELLENLVDLLDEAQKARWKEMLGDPPR